MSFLGCRHFKENIQPVLLRVSGRVKNIKNPLKRLSRATGNNDFVLNGQIYFTLNEL